MKKIFVLFVILTLVFTTSIFSSNNVNAAISEESIQDENDKDIVYEKENEIVDRSIDGGSETNGEIWYGIEVNNGDPVITYDINYEGSNLLKYLKPGDIVYEQNAGLDIIDYIGHIALVVDVKQETPTQQGYVLLIESMPNSNNPYTGEPRNLGVCYALMTPTRFTEKYVSIMRVKNVTDEQIQGAIQFAKDQVEDDDIWLFRPWKETDVDHDKWYCSELVWAAYYHQGVFLEPHDNSAVLPSEIYESSVVSTIMRYNSPTTFSEKTDNYHTYSCDGDTYTEAHDYEVYNYCYEKCRACEHVRLAIEHDYTNSYVSKNNSYHYSYCVCGSLKTNPHTLECDGSENGVHYEKCADCGYRLNQFTEGEYSDITSTNHRKTCGDCGYTEIENHNLGYAKVNSTQHKKYCIECGYVKSTASHNYTYSYTPTFRNQHTKTCICGDSVIEFCVGRAIIGGTSSKCMYCGQEIITIINPLSVDDDAILPNNKEDEEYK